MANISSGESASKDTKDTTTATPVKPSECTGFYGFYCSLFRSSPLMSRHNSWEEANQKAQEFVENTKRQNGPSAFCPVYVKELPITKCRLPELKKIAKREGISTTKKSKKDLMAILEPLILHQKHLYVGEEIDVKECKQCQKEHVEEYKQYLVERENDPVVKEHKAMKKMYCSSLVNPITQNKVKLQFGLTFDDLKEGIVSEQLHFRKRCTFGNYYWQFEKGEIIRYHRKKKQLEAGKAEKHQQKQQRKKDNEKADENHTKIIRKSRKRKGEFTSTLDASTHTTNNSKKRKLNEKSDQVEKGGI